MYRLFAEPAARLSWTITAPTEQQNRDAMEQKQCTVSIACALQFYNMFPKNDLCANQSLNESQAVFQTY
jgi:hypothetical protein